MTLTTEYLEIANGEGWTAIENTSEAFSIQNIAEVLLEYTFSPGIKRGSYLTPYTVVSDVQQTIYVRFYNPVQNGAVSITRVSV